MASASSSSAQSFFSEPVAFKVGKTCKASTNTKGSKGLLTVRSGQSFQALGENAPTDGKFVYLDTNGTRRCLPLSGGGHASSKPFRPAACPTSKATRWCLAASTRWA